MAVRAKFTVTNISENIYGATSIDLEPRYDDSIPEDRRFYDATPSGHMEMMVNNPAAIEQFELGKEFYVDFTPVEDAGA